MITSLVIAILAQNPVPQSNPEAVKLLNAIPDAFAKLNAVQMKLALRISVADQHAEVATDVIAMKPNLFVITQTGKGPEGPESRKFFCDGKMLAFPEPRNPQRYITDPGVPTRWCEALRSFSSLMLDNGWPLGLMFRTKPEIESFVRQLTNVQIAEEVDLDGSKAKIVTAALPAGKQPRMEMEFLIGADGLLHKMILRSDAMSQTSTETVKNEDEKRWHLEPSVTEVKSASTMVWDITYTKDPALTKEMFKLPPTRGPKP
jgi:hypothetical protein